MYNNDAIAIYAIALYCSCCDAGNNGCDGGESLTLLQFRICTLLVLVPAVEEEVVVVVNSDVM